MNTTPGNALTERIDAYFRATQAQDQLAHAQRKIASLKKRFDLALDEVERRREASKIEEKEAQEWSGDGWKVTFWRLIGKLEARQELENREAIEAAAAFAIANDVKEDLRQQLDAAKNELSQLESLAKSVAQRRQDALRSIKNSMPGWAPKIEHLCDKLRNAEFLRTEFDQALVACREARSLTTEAIGSFDTAGHWAGFDLMGGGMIISMIKRRHIDKGLSEVSAIERALEKVRVECADLNRHSLPITSLMTWSASWAFDVFFDNLFSDWKSLNLINGMGESLQFLDGKLIKLEYELNSQLKGNAAALKEYEQELETVILSSIGT